MTNTIYSPPLTATTSTFSGQPFDLYSTGDGGFDPTVFANMFGSNAAINSNNNLTSAEFLSMSTSLAPDNIASRYPSFRANQVSKAGVVSPRTSRRASLDIVAEIGPEPVYQPQGTWSPEERAWVDEDGEIKPLVAKNEPKRDARPGSSSLSHATRQQQQSRQPVLGQGTTNPHEGQLFVNSVQDPKGSPVQEDNTRYHGCPSRRDTEIMVFEFLSKMTVQKRERTMLSGAMYEEAVAALLLPDNRDNRLQAYCKRTFELHYHEDGEPYLLGIVSSDKKLPVIVFEKIWETLCWCHAACGHGGRDKTNTIVRLFYGGLHKDIIQSFILQCPRCQSRKTATIDNDESEKYQLSDKPRGFLLGLQDTSGSGDGGRQTISLAAAKARAAFARKASNDQTQGVAAASGSSSTSVASIQHNGMGPNHRPTLDLRTMVNQSKRLRSDSFKDSVPPSSSSSYRPGDIGYGSFSTSWHARPTNDHFESRSRPQDPAQCMTKRRKLSISMPNSCLLPAQPQMQDPWANVPRSAGLPSSHHAFVGDLMLPNSAGLPPTNSFDNRPPGLMGPPNDGRPVITASSRPKVSRSLSQGFLPHQQQQQQQQSNEYHHFLSTFQTTQYLDTITENPVSTSLDNSTSTEWSTTVPEFSNYDFSNLVPNIPLPQNAANGSISPLDTSFSTTDFTLFPDPTATIAPSFSFPDMLADTLQRDESFSSDYSNISAETSIPTPTGFDLSDRRSSTSSDTGIVKIEGSSGITIAVRDEMDFSTIFDLDNFAPEASSIHNNTTVNSPVKSCFTHGSTTPIPPVHGLNAEQHASEGDSLDAEGLLQLLQAYSQEDHNHTPREQPLATTDSEIEDGSTAPAPLPVPEQPQHHLDNMAQHDYFDFTFDASQDMALFDFAAFDETGV